MPKQIITSPDAPVTGFTDKTTPSPLAQAVRAGQLLFVSGQGPLDPKTREVVSADIREFMAGEKVTRTCVGATPHRKGVNVEIDCVASFDE